jgi:hypothetical protein
MCLPVQYTTNDDVVGSHRVAIVCAALKWEEPLTQQKVRKRTVGLEKMTSLDLFQVYRKKELAFFAASAILIGLCRGMVVVTLYLLPSP